MPRRVLIVGNWKMNGLIETAMELAEAILAGLSKREQKKLLCEVVVAPPFTALHPLHQKLGESSLKLAGQNMSAQKQGAYTGEVCGLMLRNVGCRYVILGHSERRRFFHETDQDVTRKVAAAFRDGLAPIVCLGEELAERQAGRTLEVVDRQLNAVLGALSNVEEAKCRQLVLAYEPVWAIGTGHTATPQQAQEVHAHLRRRLQGALGAEAADKVRVLYGGSMTADNAPSLLMQEDVDGGLIGGASLKAQDFLAILDAVKS